MLEKNGKRLYLTRFFTIFIVGFFTIGAISVGTLGYLVFSSQINDLRNQHEYLQNEISILSNSCNITYIDDNISFSQLYKEIKDSVVLVHGLVVQYTFFGPQYSEGLGSGFIYEYKGQMVVITNYHVVFRAVNITVTFSNGNAYPANLIGSDAYADLAILSVDAPPHEFYPLPIISSTTLEVGDPVIAIGNPFKLEGSMTTGIVSQLGRTIENSLAGNFLIANIIQTSTPINPGNSGGPLLNYLGQVVGITTAILANSQGVGFAVPSNTILREIEYIVATGSYNKHPWLGISGIDMNYNIAKEMKVNITYGWLITQTMNGGSADNAGLKGGTKQLQIAGKRVVIGGDIIIAVNEKRIVNGDNLMTYLEEHTLPYQIINVTILRNDQIITLPVELGIRSQSGF